MPSEVSMSGADQVRRTSEELERDLAEAREQQAATAEILRVISSSPTDVQPVFDTIARSAARLCEALDVMVLRVDGDVLRLVAHYGPMPAGDVALHLGTVGGRTVIERRVIHVRDVQTEVDEFPEGSAIGRERGQRTTLSCPLLKANMAIGNIQARRNEVRPFSDQQVSLLKTFADQAVIAIENTRMFEAEQASKRELTEALEQQTATSEVLRVIGSSPTNVQPVFDTLAENAVRLCSAERAFISRFDGEVLRVVASHNALAEHISFLERNPFLPGRQTATGRAALERRTIHIHDVLADPEYTYGAQQIDPYRTVLAIPMLTAGKLLGVIVIYRHEVQPFTHNQIALMETFADQAVIAIENAHLFEEVQARTRDLTEALEQQTATADVLKVISRSALNVQKVLDALVESAARLCDAYDAAIFQVVGENLRLVAHHGQISFTGPVGQHTIPLVRGLIGGRAVIDRRTIQIADMQTEADEYPDSRSRALQHGWRTSLAVPLVHAGEAIGVIFIRRGEVRPFTERQIELVNTFADQAVIAIENTRLFDEVQARTAELGEALEQQTASSEVLGIISSTPGQLDPVFRVILRNATRLCDAKFGTLFLREGDGFRTVATHNAPAAFAEAVARDPIFRPPPDLPLARAAITKKAAQEDLAATRSYIERHPFVVNAVELAGYRIALAVPMLKDNELIGSINILRQEVRPFTEKQIELLKSFADQAVIAIGNTRLFEEVQARNRDLTALGEVGRAVSSTLDLKLVLKTIVERAVELSGTHGGSIFYFREDIGRFELGETTSLTEDVIARFRKLDIAAGQTGLGEAIAAGKPLQIADITKRSSNALRDAAIEAGMRAALIVPLLSGEGPLGALVLQRRDPGEFPPQVVRLMQAFADQSAIALENARLFNEIAQKSRELEIASQHKSQFVANMSHELRTPLAAILGYAELMQEGFYEPLGQKSLDALTRIRSNGKHLLGLINTVLDIAKIESGQFTLNMTEYAIESVVETVRAATESLAQNKKVSLTTSVDKALPIGLGDEQRLTQVLLNLVGNAIKFTDTGEVRVTAKAINGHFNVSVTDTGLGIPEEHQARIFEQFHQVDSSNTKAKGGTGLGLAIAKQIVEMHGGRIWVESTVGKGSTFQMEIPARAQVARSA
jgi:signal transduction histidine kinase